MNILFLFLTSSLAFLSHLLPLSLLPPRSPPSFPFLAFISGPLLLLPYSSFIILFLFLLLLILSFLSCYSSLLSSSAFLSSSSSSTSSSSAPSSSSSYSSSASSEPFLFIATPLHPSPPPLLHQPLTPLHPLSPLPLQPSFLSHPLLLQPLHSPCLLLPPPLHSLYLIHPLHSLNPSSLLPLPFTLLPIFLCNLRFFPLLFSFILCILRVFFLLCILHEFFLLCILRVFFLFRRSRLLFHHPNCRNSLVDFTDAMNNRCHSIFSLLLNSRVGLLRHCPTPPSLPPTSFFS